MKSIVLLVTYHVRHGEGAAFLRAIRDAEIPAQIHREEGCIAYDYFFSSDDPDTVLLAEEWASEACQQRHLLTPHMARLAAIKAQFVTDTSVRRLTPQ